ncbi:unnamed protein product [Periconia digitata]|uniref:Uncharacterized protein n=1 Tax=Periconia digitata TaxID=1303443 RepID=A0A9W4UHK8_9PLEO|nr:unnamed protein product [Periconia digitata]
MATASLTPNNIRSLAQVKGYWEDEASVNGIWAGLLADAFPGSANFVLQPEGQGNEVSKKRNDILVRHIPDCTKDEQHARLAFEGKSSKSADTMDTASAQLRDFLNATPKMSPNKKMWGIVAKGLAFRLFFFNDDKLDQLKIDINGKPSRGAGEYELGAANKPGCVESVTAFLNFAKANPAWIIQ